jgi:hypothetical protein
MPGLELDVIALFPAAAVPITLFIAPISLSACKNTPPLLGIRLGHIRAISVWGVMGYP